MPVLAVSQALKERGADILYLGHTAADRQLAETAGIRFRRISAGKLRRYASWRNLVDPFKVLGGFVQSYFILGRFRPDVVFAKGGFVSLPVVRAAHLRKVPVVLHESDTIAGLANRQGSNYANAIAVAWPTEAVAGLPKEKLVLTGNPVRSEVLKGQAKRAERRYKLQGEPLVLVLGGSQGSLALNRLVTEALPELLKQAHVAHQVGAAAGADITEITGKLPPTLRSRYHPRGYFDQELFDLYAAASVVISRAGANTLAEIATRGLPSILIPLPSAASGHQRANARVFAEAGAAIMLEQDGLDAVTLHRTVTRLLHNSQQRAEMGRAARRLAEPDATQKLVDLIWRHGERDG